jgi:hypothetical protein
MLGDVRFAAAIRPGSAPEAIGEMVATSLQCESHKADSSLNGTPLRIVSSWRDSRSFSG